MQERLQKILAHHGVASRRHAEELIEAGRVTLNGVKATLGQKADPAVDTITVDGKPLSATVDTLYYLMNKPVGYVTTNLDAETWNTKLRMANEKLRLDSSSEIRKSPLANRNSAPSSQRANTSMPKQIEKTVRELLPAELRGKIVPVGRLDKETSGLLLLTNDGELAYRLTHPQFPHEREYAVEFKDPVTDGALNKVKNGVLLDGTKTKPAVVKRIDDRTVHIAVSEGRYRQVRRMFSKVGAEVVRLERIRIVTLRDAWMAEGEIRPLEAEEIAQLRKAVGL